MSKLASHQGIIRTVRHSHAVSSISLRFSNFRQRVLRAYRNHAHRFMPRVFYNSLENLHDDVDATTNLLVDGEDLVSPSTSILRNSPTNIPRDLSR